MLDPSDPKAVRLVSAVGVYACLIILTVLGLIVIKFLVS